jgi:hypothetical protein
MRRLVLIVLLLAAAAGSARADGERPRVTHLPPAEAAPGAPLTIDARIDRAWQGTIELRWRPVGQPEWRTALFERTGTGDDRWRAQVPAQAVQPPGLEYWIAGAVPGAPAVSHFASAEAPHVVMVHDDPKVVAREKELARYRGRRARARVALEWVDFGSRDVAGRVIDPTTGMYQEADFTGVDDRYLRVDADFSYRVLRFPLHSLRFGYTYLLGDTPATGRGDGTCAPEHDDGVDDDLMGTPRCAGQAGYKVSGWFEARLRVTSVVDVDLRVIVAAVREFVLGGRAELRFGSELGSHVALGLEGVPGAGATFFFRLGWDTVPRFPMAATIELSDLPSSHRATAVRLLYDVGVPLDSGVRLGVRLGYQARDAEIGGVTAGANLALEF